MFLEEDQYFSMSANVTNPGYQTIALQGYLVKRNNNDTYIAPLLPQLFYGADGNQLSTWRQYLENTGEQVVLSRSGGHPSVPTQDLYWRKVKSQGEMAPAQVTYDYIDTKGKNWTIIIHEPAYPNFTFEASASSLSYPDTLTYTATTNALALEGIKAKIEDYINQRLPWTELIKIWWNNLPTLQKAAVISAGFAGIAGTIYLVKK